MIYYTGDIHGLYQDIEWLCKKYNPSSEDTVVILGDVAANFDLGRNDKRVKEHLNKLAPTILCIHGNHEIRPANIPSYITKVWNGGMVWYEEEYPNILFARDGEIFNLDGLRHLVIGGAYSVDKFYRLRMGYGWWEDEQPSAEIKEYVERQVKHKEFDIILSHTCPYKYEPREMFIQSVDQSTIDKSTEEWLDKIEEKVDYIAWFCGHWHTDKRIDKMHFLYNSVETSEQFIKEN